MEDIDNGTTNNTDNGTVKETTTKSLDVGEDSGKSLDVGESTNKEIEEGEDPHKTLPTRDHETKKINESDHETKANDEAYEEPKEEVKADLFNLDYFDKPEEASPEVQEKASELINGDLNYFDNWITEAEDQKKQNKEQLDAYLKSNVESGNQLAYTQEDLTEAQQNLQNALDDFNSSRMDLGLGAPRQLENILRDGTYGNSTDRNEIKQKLAESGFEAASGLNPLRRDEMLNKWADTIANYNEQKQIQEDLGRNGPTVNRGITKAEENNLLERAASDYSSLSDAEKEMIDKVADYTTSRGLHSLNQPYNPLEPDDSPTNREIFNRNERLNNAIYNAITTRDAERRRAAEASTSETPPTRTETPVTSSSTTETSTTSTEPTREETPTETPSSSTPTTSSTPETRTEVAETAPSETTSAETETPTTEEETPETESTESSSEVSDESETPTEEPETPTTSEDVIAKADEAKAAYEEAKKREYEAIHREADETEIAQLAAEVERLRQEWEEAEAEAAALRPREDGEDESKEPRTGHGREDRELSKEETLPEWIGGDDPHTSSAGAYWAGAFGDENWSDKVPQKTAQGLINYANDHHDNPLAMFGMTALMEAGGYDALKAGRDVQDMISAAKDVYVNANNAIDFFKNGSVLDGIKSILSTGWSALKVLGNALSAAWNVCKSTFSFLRSVFAPLSSAVSSFLNTTNGYNSVKAMIRDMYGIENTDEVIGEIFGDNSETNTKQSPVNVLNKTGFSVKGGTVTDESDYNRGMKEKENEIASDVCKKTMLYFPYLRKSFR